jgi:hypothetical protein
MSAIDELPMPVKIQLLEIMAGPHGTPPTSSQPADILVVFGAADPQLAYDAAQLHNRGEVSYVVFTGGMGKDSGPLTALRIAEADFLASVAVAAGLPPDVILIERNAKNAAQNAALALRSAASAGLIKIGTTVASLAPAQRSRRLYEELRFQADALDAAIRVVAGLPSGRSDVDLSSKDTSIELANELRGLSTMHTLDAPRIFALPEFQPGGRHAELVSQINSCMGTRDEVRNLREVI